MTTRSAALALLLAAAPLGAVSGLAQTTPVPPKTTVLKPESATVELGTVPAGEPAVATFVLHNPGDRVVKIIKAKPS